MDAEFLRSFFMWCSLINGGLFLFWSAWIFAAPDLVLRTQQKFLPISKEYFQNAMYAFMGLFKLGYVFFNLVPYIVLEVIT